MITPHKEKAIKVLTTTVAPLFSNCSLSRNPAPCIMGNAAARMREELLVPDKIRGLFTENDIPIVFDYLEKTFFLAKGWRAFYRREAAKLQRGSDETEFFFAFMYKYLDYSLQNIRGQTGMGRGFIIDRIVIYLMKPKIEAKRREKKS